MRAQSKMTGERDLGRLLASLSPVLMDGEFVFLSFAGAGYGDRPELEPVAAVSEPEGLTLVVPRLLADRHGLAYTTPQRGITLQVHSSLDALGLTAAVAEKLSEHGISANVVAGFYHDHIFVAAAHAEPALAALRELES